VVIGTDCIGSCIPNYHMIMLTEAPVRMTSYLLRSYVIKLTQGLLLSVVYLLNQS
jgi:hypothetical protein